MPAHGQNAADTPQTAQKSQVTRTAAGKLLGAMPLYFIPNEGQADASAQFVARGPGYQLDLRQNALAITAQDRRDGSDPVAASPVVLQFAGTNPTVQLEGSSQVAATFNYFIGNDPSKWHRSLPAYRQVRYVNFYPGIDLICYGADGGRLEYDLVVAPGADPQQIRFHFGAGHTAAIDASGGLQVDGPHGPLALGQPVFYQNVPHGKRAILGSFVQLASGEYGFRVVNYDHTRPLIVDPPINILYSTFFGGSLDDEASGMALDASGDSYVGGGTNSVDMLSTTNAFQPARGAPTAGYQVTNGFVAKFDPSGTLLYGTYLGGSNLDWVGAIAVDSQGDAYVTGLSSSSDFPTTANAYSAPGGYGNQLFISEISPDGSTLKYSTIYGVSGTSSSMANSSISSSDHTVVWGNVGIAVTSLGIVYVSGSAFPGLPTSQTAYMPSLPQGYIGVAAFVAEFNPSLIGTQQLLAASYFTAPTPSSGQNYTNTGYYGTFSYTVALDNNGNVWIGGQDQTGALPTTANAYQKTVTLGPSCAAGGPMRSAAWLAELSPTLSQLDYASYLSGGNIATGNSLCNEWIQGLASGSDGSIYAAGVTPTSAFPTTTGTLQSSYPGGQASFVSKFAPAGASLLWSTYLGSSAGFADIDSAPFVDSQNNVWVGGEVGETGSNFPVTENQLGNGQCPGTCAFVTGISSDGSSAVFSSTIGSSFYPNFTTGVGVDSAGNIHLAGTTNDALFPLSSNAVQTKLNAGLFAFAGEGDWFFTILGNGTVSVLGNYVGGNDGDDTITLAGTGFQQGATCSLVSGGTVIASTAAAVSSDGTGINCTFPLEGAALGTYNIVITEPGGSTVTKANGFTVEQAQGPNVWVNLTGRSHLRSNVPSIMTVTYGNSGDEDAMGVPVFVAIPTGVTVNVLTTLLVPPDSGPLQMSTVPQTVTIGSNTVLPLFVPRIAAGSSGSVQIEVTPPATDTELTVEAYNWEPMATSANDLITNLGTYQNGSVDSLTRRLQESIVTQVIVLDPKAASKCFQDVILLGLQVATAANPVIPPLKCASSMASFLASAATTLINASSSDYSESDAASDLGQMYAGGAQAALSCVQAAAGETPAGMAVNIISVLLANGIALSNTLSDCTKIVSINNNQNKNSSVGGSIDPNDKSGPIGDGSASQYIRQSQGLTYNLAFENQPTATLPAAQVVVTDQLDPTKMDLAAASLGLISFGGNTINIPTGLTSFTTLYSLNSTLSVKIQASLNMSTGLATWTFTTIDPTTGLPPTDPTVGFLPPDTDGIVGQGSVLINLLPEPSLTTGTQISNTASVVFDANPPISTPTWINTMDVDAPASSVAALLTTEPATNGQAVFNVSWSGTDVGSGVANYSIYVSDNGGPFALDQYETTSTSTSFTGTAGHTYGFYSIATDNVGNIEGAKTTAEATTQVAASLIATTTVVTSPSANASVGASVTLTATVTPASGAGIPTGAVTFFDGATQLGTGTLNNAGIATLSTSSLSFGTHSITATYGGDSSYMGSTSSAYTETIVDFTISSTTPSATVGSGGSATYSISTAPIGGTFSGTVTFSASGLPTGAAATFQPPSVTPAASAVMTINTTSRVEAGSAPPGNPLSPLSQQNFPKGLAAYLLAALAMITLLMAARFAGVESKVRRRLVPLCVLILAIVATGYIAGCSSRTAGEPTTNPSGTPAGTYTITVTGTSGTDVHSTTVTLIVR